VEKGSPEGRKLEEVYTPCSDLKARRSCNLSIQFTVLSLTDDTNRRIEFVDGRLVFLPMRTELHQALVAFLYQAHLRFVMKDDLGIVPFPPLSVRVPRRRYREPDVLFLSKENFDLRSIVYGRARI
jgi:Uma2 family endonuclease